MIRTVMRHKYFFGPLSLAVSLLIMFNAPEIGINPVSISAFTSSLLLFCLGCVILVSPTPNDRKKED